MENGKFKIFLSYSHKDKELMKEFVTHLSIFERQGLISTWNDRKIPPGDEWKKQIDVNLLDSDIVFLLISPDFIASDYCYCEELNTALKAHEAGRSQVVPIILRPVEWQETKFSKFQALPNNSKPITTWHNVDEAWTEVARGIRKIIEKFEENAPPRKQFFKKRLRIPRIVHAKITGRGLLGLENYLYPYEFLSDPTDIEHSEVTPDVNAFLWSPNAQYLRSKSLYPLTPVSAICTLNPDKVLAKFLKNIDSETLSYFNEQSPSRLRPDRKSNVLTAMGKALSDSFLVAVTIPSHILNVGRSSPRLSYQVIVYLFLLPLLGMHKSLDFERFNIRFSPIGEEGVGRALIKYAKPLIKARFPKNSAKSVDFIDKGDEWWPLMKMANTLAWVISAYYNQNNSDWINLLKSFFNE